MSYLRPCLLIVRIIRHRSEAGEEQRPVCWVSRTLWTEGKETCIKAPYLEGIIHLSETPSTPETLETRPMSYLRPSSLRDSIHTRNLGNPAHELSPTISPHREDHPPPFRGWRGTKSGLLGIRNSLNRRQGDLYKGTIPR